MPTVRYDNGGLSLKIEYDAAKYMLTDEALQRFVVWLEALRVAGQITMFEVKHLDSPATDWTYHFETADGRQWNQVLRFGDVIQTSGSYDLWDLDAVIEKHQIVRAETTKLIQAYDISKISATWT